MSASFLRKPVTWWVMCLVVGTPIAAMGDHGDPDGLVVGPFPPVEPHARFSVTPAVTALPKGATLVDYVDLGNVGIDPYGFGDEATHLLEPACALSCSGSECGTGTGDSWGPVCSWSDTTLRAVWECGTADTTSRSATIMMDFGDAPVHKYIGVRWQAGVADDSFDMVISGDPETSYRVTHLQSGSNACFNIGVWDVGVRTGLHIVTCTATGTMWGSQPTYGQVMLSELAVWEDPGEPQKPVQITLIARDTPSLADAVGGKTCMGGTDFGQPCEDDGDCTLGGAGVCTGLAALPTSETSFDVGDTFYVEMWAQTTQQGGLSAVYADLLFDPNVVTATEIAHTMAFTVAGIDPEGTIDNPSGLVDDVGGPHLDSACATSFGMAPAWVRVAHVTFTADEPGDVVIASADTGSGFGNAICGVLGVVDPSLVAYDDLELQVYGTNPTIRLDVSGAPVARRIGEQIEVLLSVADLPVAINGVQALIHYDSDLLRLVGIQATELGLTPPSEGWVEISETDVDGDIAYAAEILGASMMADDVVATLTFEAIGVGTPVVDFLPDHPPAHPTLATKLTDAGTAQAIVPIAVGTLSGDINILADMCLIAGVMYDAGDTNPGNDCDVCDPLVAVDRWSPRPVGTACGDLPGPCARQDTCDGLGTCADMGLKEAGTLCRAAAGDCDVAEYCDGVAAACPTDGFAHAAWVCRPAAGACDAAEFCPGDGPICPADESVASGTECRAAAGDCDVAEFCDGMAVDCPDDVFADAGTECRASSTPCDPAEFCTGEGPDCPADVDDATYIDVNIEIEFLTGVGGVYGTTPACPDGSCVTRDVTFVIGMCGGDSETRVVPVTFEADLGHNVGYGSVMLADVDIGADWIQASEGHTLARVLPLTFDGPGGCAATADFSGANVLMAGDYSGVGVLQDNLVDITDFAILAIEWNQIVPAGLGTLADASGDGIQDSFDFAPLQIHYAQAGDDERDVCRGDGTNDRKARLTPRGWPAARRVRAEEPRSWVAVQDLDVPNVHLADINQDGIVDKADIRAFAAQHGFLLTERFQAQLNDMAGVSETRERVPDKAR